MSLENSPISSVCHIFYDSITKRSFLVDPGAEDASGIENFLEDEELVLDYIILTHEHFDHIWGCNALIQRYNAPIVCSQYCSEAILYPKTNLSVFFNPQKAFCVKPKSTIIVGDGDEIMWNGMKISFYSAEGHSKGGLLIFIDKYIITGDTLIKGIKTVTKLRNASKEKLMDSIRLLDAYKGHGTVICPGHGENFDLDSYDLSIAIK